MSPTDDNLPIIDEGLFDLLVDGELSDSQRRDLLVELDQVPDGWRRCALAFLEDQCWKDELRAIWPAPASQTPAARTARRRDQPTTLRAVPVGALPGGKWGKLLAVAASFLAALLLGFVLREAWNPGGRAGVSPTDVAKVQLPEDISSQTAQTEIPRQDSFPEPGAPGSRWQYVTLPVAGGADSLGESVRLPAVEREDIDEAWLSSFPAAVPADLVKALQQTGHQVQQQRRLMPLTMEDGRHLVVPFDQVEVRYVGHRAYQ